MFGVSVIAGISSTSSRFAQTSRMAATYLKSLNKEQFKAFIESFDVVLSDCDGVLWRETEIIKGSPAAVVKFKQLGKRYFYITNNNGKTRSELAEKCKNFKYDATEEEILSASYLAAVYLKEQNFKKKAYVVGGSGITQELEAQGIKYTGDGPDIMEGDELDTLLNFKRDPEVGAVIIGFDKHFSYPKLVKAATYAHDRSVHFIGTNPDLVRPSPNENRFPGAGCFLRTIEAASARKAMVLGKPETYVSQIIKKKYGVDPSRTLMIGDNLDTDIQLGKRCGYKTLLVMSGVTTNKDLETLKKNCEESILPDYYADQLSDLLDCFSS